MCRFGHRVSTWSSSPQCPAGDLRALEGCSARHPERHPADQTELSVVSVATIVLTAFGRLATGAPCLNQAGLVLT